MKIQVQGTNVDLPAGLNQEITVRAKRAFERFSTSVRRVEIVVNDENGPRGGTDTRCLLNLGAVSHRPDEYQHTPLAAPT